MKSSVQNSKFISMSLQAKTLTAPSLFFNKPGSNLLQKSKWPKKSRAASVPWLTIADNKARHTLVHLKQKSNQIKQNSKSWILQWIASVVTRIMLRCTLLESECQSETQNQIMQFNFLPMTQVSSLNKLAFKFTTATS